MNNSQKRQSIILRVMQRFYVWFKQMTCEHKEWDCDTQIRVIECKKCKKRAWIRDYRSLF
jgi:hypothetical protein